MHCTKAEHLVADKALGLLSDDLRKELDSHLAACSRCRKQAGEYVVATQALAVSGSGQMQPDLADRVVALAESGERKHFRLLQLPVPALAAAAVLLAVIISPVFFLQNDDQNVRMEVLQAYAEDLEYFGAGNSATLSDAEFSYGNYGVSGNVTDYLPR